MLSFPYGDRICFCVFGIMVNYTDMTDEEYDALDEELTHTIPKIAQNGIDWLSQRDMFRLGMSTMTVNYLFTKAAAVNKKPGQIIDELVGEKITAAI
jgi:hypothetical protein